jgi:lipoate-protein ligase A
MHHGTIMFDTDMSLLGDALNVSADKIESKGIKSVRSRVTNIKPYMSDQNVTMPEFWEALREYMFRENDMESYTLSVEDLAAVEKLRQEVYATWEWNYGASPAHSIHKARRVEGCGKIEVYIDVDAKGAIGGMAFYGDYFGNGDSRELAALLKGRKMEEAGLRQALAGVELGKYFAGITEDDFIEVLLR